MVSGQGGCSIAINPHSPSTLFSDIFEEIQDGLKRLQNMVPSGAANMQEGLKKVQDSSENLFCFIKFLEYYWVFSLPSPNSVTGREMSRLKMFTQ